MCKKTFLSSRLETFMYLTDLELLSLSCTLKNYWTLKGKNMFGHFFKSTYLIRKIKLDYHQTLIAMSMPEKKRNNIFYYYQSQSQSQW